VEATLAQLASLVGAVLRGDPATRICAVAGVQAARAGDIALLADSSYLRFLAATRASALLVGPDFDPAATSLPLLVSQRPSHAMEAIAAHLCPPEARPEPGVHPTAIVAADAQLGPGTSIQAYAIVEAGALLGAGTVLRPFALVGRAARLGANCFLHPHAVVLDRCILGDRVILHSGAVIGADGYGYEFKDGVHHKLLQRGIVEIGDDVEIGANTTIDRARYGRTVVGAGTKIDNLVMVSHNDVIGEHCLLVAQCGFAGTTVLGHHVTVAAQAGVKDHIVVGDGATIGAKAGVMRDVAPGQTVLGTPAQDIGRERQSLVLHQRLPELYERIRALTQKLGELQKEVARLEKAAEDHPEAG